METCLRFSISGAFLFNLNLYIIRLSTIKDNQNITKSTNKNDPVDVTVYFIYVGHPKSNANGGVLGKCKTA